MANVLGEEKREQIVALGRLGWSLRRIERETGIHRDTAGHYLRAAGIPVRRRGGLSSIWPPEIEAAKPATTERVITDPGGAKPATTERAITGPTPREMPGLTPSACEPHREFIEHALRLGRNTMAIYQDLVTKHGFAARYNSVRRFVLKLRRRPAVEAHPVTTTAPGEEAQVDYGEGPMIMDPQTGKYQRSRLFVLTLALRWKRGYRRCALCAFIWKGKSHLAPAIGRTAIQHEHRGLYREAHVLMEEIADTTIDGSRKAKMLALAAAPLGQGLSNGERRYRIWHPIEAREGKVSGIFGLDESRAGHLINGKHSPVPYPPKPCRHD